MEAKYKAKQLIGKYSELVPNDFGGMDDELAKQCALIAVDELIEEAYFTDGYYARQKYWQEVKQEICDL